MHSFPDTWLVIPLYNEAEVVGDVVRGALPTFPHIVCVDDGSRDGSAEVAIAAGAVVVQHPINLGQGAALQTGFDYVRTQTDGRYVVTFDSDGQHRVSDAVAMRQRAEADDLAIVYGSRFLGTKAQTGWLKALVLKTAALVTRWQTGLRLTDAHNGLRLLRRDALDQVNLQQNRMAHASEIVEQLSKTDLPWAEMPVHIDYTDYSRAKGQSLFNSVNILVELVMR
ncbi:glycosyltransferase family 2 protein [Schaalia sp. 19OD2882]|uniref:glycosyltransferase family 2 protein n=1 Tax=Schaalia sp. 19OD2882 TaxID=2794089 RepID=UPI001C1EFA95|nr:glycosyltransferase family 2 protein [Schaalia sp. 19OD2882]QWW20259.1 glycosyltransferase family 2 protein [Schaalia sp. 19OD2882]